MRTFLFAVFFFPALTAWADEPSEDAGRLAQDSVRTFEAASEKRGHSEKPVPIEALENTEDESAVSPSPRKPLYRNAGSPPYPQADDGEMPFPEGSPADFSSSHVYTLWLRSWQMPYRLTADLSQDAALRAAASEPESSDGFDGDRILNQLSGDGIHVGDSRTAFGDYLGFDLPVLSGAQLGLSGDWTMYRVSAGAEVSPEIGRLGVIGSGRFDDPANPWCAGVSYGLRHIPAIGVHRLAINASGCRSQGGLNVSGEF